MTKKIFVAVTLAIFLVGGFSIYETKDKDIAKSNNSSLISEDVADKMALVMTTIDWTYGLGEYHKWGIPNDVFHSIAIKEGYIIHSLQSAEEFIEEKIERIVVDKVIEKPEAVSKTAAKAQPPITHVSMGSANSERPDPPLSPEPQKEDVGTESTETVKENNQEKEETEKDKKEYIIMVSTAYTHTGNKTFTGTVPKAGTVAVDPTVIPLGTRLYIEGYGYGTAEDIGSAIKGNVIDVFLDTYDEAIKWGRREVKVYILD